MNCPKCKTRMKKERVTYETDDLTLTDDLRLRRIKVTRSYIRYTCPKCGYSFTMSREGD